MESDHVAQDEDGELARRQDLKGCHEGQRDGFGLLVACLRSERHIGRTIEQGVRKWLQPHDLAEAGRLGRFNVGHVPLSGWSSARDDGRL